MAIDHEVRILTQDEYPLWDTLVMKSPQGTVFHSSKWVEACAELSSKKEILYGFFKNDTLEGGCSVYSYKKYYCFSIAVSNELLTPFGGYILAPYESSKVRENEKTSDTIISEINKELIKKFHYINIVNSPQISDIRPFVWNRWKPSIYYAYFFDLNGHIEENLSKNVRRTIRKGQKSDITINKENDPDLYYTLYCKTYEKQHLPPPVSKKFLLTMIDVIISNNLGEMWIARTPTGEPAAAEIIIWDNKFAHRWSAVSDEQFNDTGATSLLLFEIFQDLFQRGFREINLMAGNTPHLAKFISSFNPRLVPYYGVEKFFLF